MPKDNFSFEKRRKEMEKKAKKEEKKKRKLEAKTTPEEESQEPIARAIGSGNVTAMSTEVRGIILNRFED